MPVNRKGGGDESIGASVGPYWFVRSPSGEIVLLEHRCLLAEAEEYGNFLTCPHGHYEVWDRWRNEGQPFCCEYEYEDWPRGRVVFDRVSRRFTVYGDRQVFAHDLQNRVLNRFGISADQAQFMTDEHYQSTESLKETR